MLFLFLFLYVCCETEKASPVILVPLKDVPAHEGDTVSLDVKVSGSPLPQVKWLRDSKTVTETSRVRFTRDQNTLGLLIIKIQPTDAGVYKAVIDNDVGKCISTATITVGRKYSLYVKYLLLCTSQCYV